MPPLLPDAGPGSDAQCQAAVTWASLYLAVLLPVLASIFTHKPPAQQQQQQRSCSGLRRLRCQLARGVAAADRWLVGCLARRSAPLARALVRWWALGYCWELAKTLVLLPTDSAWREQLE